MKTGMTFKGSGLLLAILFAGWLQGCAVSPKADPRDPWEPFNRSVTRFNDRLDEVAIRPVAVAYQKVTPGPVRLGVNNFFGNVSDVWSLVNNMLQLKPVESVETLMRVSINTFFGFGGVLDVASEMRLEKHKEDFGQTLGHWGVPTGPYLVLPLAGPSTVRDSVAYLVDTQVDTVAGLPNVPARNSLLVLRAVDIRSNLLRATDFLEGAALDKYTFVRDAYLQRRRSLVKEETSDAEERFDLPESGLGSASTASVPLNSN